MYLKAEQLPLSLLKGCGPVDGDSHDVPMQIRTADKKRAERYRMKFGAAASRKDLSPVMPRDKPDLFWALWTGCVLSVSFHAGADGTRRQKWPPRFGQGRKP
jgi:hypothetical protein